MSMEKAFAWLVHAYTAAGLLAAAAMAVFIVRGGDDSFRWAFMMMVVATAIDSTDGWLARKARVKEVLPDFDGRTLDDLTDFHTYTSMPLLLMWRAQILPGHFAWFLLVALLASAYGFSRADAKTPDGFFLGFPSYWNVVAFYLYLLSPPAWFSASVVIVCSILTFVPMRYLYMTRGGPFAKVMLATGTVWAAMTAVIILRPASERRTLGLISLAYPLLYVALSWIVTASRKSP
jgi:phosphatidylcholine synthase